MTCRCLAPAVVVALFATAVMAAGVDSQAPPPPEPPQAAQKPTFRSEVILVEIDVVALDRANLPVTGMSQDEFRVLENGQPKDLASFAPIELPVPQPRGPAARDVVPNTGEERGRLVFLILDDANSLRARTQDITRAARRLVEGLAPADQVGLLWVSLSHEGAREFTSDHAAVLRAIDQFEAHDTLIERRVGPDGESPHPPAFEPDEVNAGVWMEDTWRIGGMDLVSIFEGDRPLNVVRNVSRYLTTLDRRRKLVVYIGQGAVRPHGQPTLLPTTIDAAQASNVTLYAIDPSGPADAETELVNRLEGPQWWSEYMAASAATGGFATRRTDPEDGVDRVLTATSAYYLLGYYAEPARPEEKERTIEVRTTRPGVRILARKRYAPAERTPAATPREAVSRAVRDLVPSADLALKAFVAPFRDSTRKEQPLAVAVEVAAPEFRAAAAGAGFEDDVEIVVLSIEGGVKVRQTQRVTARVALSTERVGALAGGRYLVCTSVDLAPGHYQLRFGVWSEAAGRAGSVYYDVDVPDFGDEAVSLSGLVIGQRESASPTPVARASTIATLVPFVPVLAREFTARETPWAYLRVYRTKKAGDGPVTLSASIRDVETDAEVWAEQEEHHASEIDADPGFEYRVSLPITSLAPGTYRLRVEASGPGGQRPARRELDFRVLPDATPPEPHVGTASASDLREGPSRLLQGYADPALRALIDATSRYLDEYLDSFTSVVAEETYEQVLRWQRSVVDRLARRLRSDFLLVQLSGRGLVPFRDVFEVDGKPVRDRDDRLRRLFLEMPEGALDTARRILDEGARYNVGLIVRTVNQPMLALKFLAPEHLPALELSLGGEERVEGVTARRLDFRETGSPTIVRDQNLKDRPSSGSFWIEVGTGRIVKTLVRNTVGFYSAETTVIFRPFDETGLLAPAEMRESYVSADERIYGTARYANFRRFQVKTEVEIKK